jgi:hypothetical protein
MEPKPRRRRADFLAREHYRKRVFQGIRVGALLVAGSLVLGMCGYHFVVGLPWIDALLNASMILTGMGPVDPVRTTAGKLFASAYALFSGVIFLTTAALVFAPAVHRFLHRFHLELEDEDGPPHA